MDLRMDALRILMPNGHAYSGDEKDYELTKPDGSPDKIPTLEEIKAKVAELRKDYDAQAYARNRQTDYPPIGDQLDALYHAGVFPTDMAAKIKKVKDDNPKG